MKKNLLITGADSYIGCAVEAFLSRFPDEYSVTTLDMRDEKWYSTDFSAFDTVFHIAGIAHQKETEENKALYYKVNRDLAVKTAEKAKNDGVGHFIFMSSMSVYGLDEGHITADTRPVPITNYGKSKLQAEEKIRALTDDSFHVAVLRPPMVYGKNCKGNFTTVVKLVEKLPVFPKLANNRSMIYIENLCSFVKTVADNKLEGLFFPQNDEYVNTSEMAKLIAAAMGKKLPLLSLGGVAVKILKPFSGTLRKAFGSLVYDKSMTVNPDGYTQVTFRQSIEESIK